MKQGGWASLTLIYLYGVVSAASLTKAIPLQAHITHLPGATVGLFGLFVSLMAVLPAIFGTLSGAVIDRMGARPACSWTTGPWLRGDAQAHWWLS